jgi:N-acetylglucosamine-6-sulfatase
VHLGRTVIRLRYKSRRGRSLSPGKAPGKRPAIDERTQKLLEEDLREAQKSTHIGSRLVLLLSSMVLAVVLLWGAYSGSAPFAAQTSSQPNIVFIIADDMRYDDLAYMPKTRKKLVSQGMTFSRAYVAKPLCCPSRTSILTGMYTHNHKVWFNANSSEGGWQGFKAQGHEQDNLATRLNGGGGYRTGLFGQYIKNYDGSSVPPGWDDWFGQYGGSYYSLDVNDNGTDRHYGNSASDYGTDVISNEAQSFIATSAQMGEPFFAYVAVTAPHYPTKAAPRDLNTYDGLKAPRPPSFHEDDVSDKPPWIRSLPKLRASQITHIDTRQEDRAETLQALDDLVKGVVTKLDSAGVLENTYIFFTSDNGFEMGEHRIFDGKRLPYEESIRAPLLVRGPGVAAGSTTKKLVLNTDFFPTFTDLGGIQTPSYVDGRSLRPVLNGSATTWRTAILLETRFESGTKKNFYGIRTRNGRKYIEYGGGFRELYNLNTDAHELSNTYNATSPPTSLAARLQELKGCAGDSCRALENGQWSLWRYRNSLP